ncbi:type IV secretion system protein [Roseibium suaedae]|nr:type IV secretion system protein [Roseibium suaedae]
MSAVISGSASASGIPVIDAASIAQAITQVENQVKDYAEQLKQLATMKEQLTTQLSQLTAMTGTKNIAGLLNSQDLKDLRQSAESLNGIMSSVMSGGGIAGQSTAIKAKVDELKTNFGFTNLNALMSSEHTIDRAAAQLAGAGVTAVATSEDGFTKADAAAKRVTDLIDGIDSRTPDLKASIDYNTRVQAEVAVLLVELLRVQSANANAVGMSQAATARDVISGRKFILVGDKEEE